MSDQHLMETREFEVVCVRSDVSIAPLSVLTGSSQPYIFETPRDPSLTSEFQTERAQLKLQLRKGISQSQILARENCPKVVHRRFSI